MYKVIARQCTKCGFIKLLDNFCNSKDGKFKKKTQCKACDKAYTEKCKLKEKWVTIWKPCSRCNIKKIGSEYSKSTKSYDGLSAMCKECEHTIGKIYYYNNTDKIQAYRDAHKDRQIAYNHEYYFTNHDEILEKQHVYGAEHKDAISVKTKQFREENPEYMSQYRADNREALLEWARGYRLRNPEKLHAASAKRRAFGFDPVNVAADGFHAHHLWLNDNKDLVIYLPIFLHYLHSHDHNKPETMITPNALALDYWIHEELYSILYYEDSTWDRMTITALDSGIVSFTELSDMMYKSRITTIEYCKQEEPIQIC